jgi:ribosome-binding protein aMBF1 (putative translation factor)
MPWTVETLGEVVDDEIMALPPKVQDPAASDPARDRTSEDDPMTTLRALKRKLLADPEVRAEYEALKLEEKLAAELTRVRVSAGLTQAQLAKRMKAKQAAIARVESGRHLPNLDTLRGYAAATGQRLVVSFKPDRKRRTGRRRATAIVVE